MMSVGAVATDAGVRTGSNAVLVAACLAGDQEAWAILIERYKRLIYSIPVKYGFSPDDAAEIFQAVCVDLVAALPRLREPDALPLWLIRTTARKCSRHRKRVQAAVVEIPPDLPDSASLPESMIQELQQEQALRDAVGALPRRCRRLIEMLFFETPPRPYAAVAAHLGVATGSIGFIRSRCLDRLRRALVKAGL